MTKVRYLEGIKDDIQLLKEYINKSLDGKIMIKAEDVRKRMGSEFEKDELIDIYYGLRSELFDEGLVVEQGIHIDGSMVLIFRNVTELDNNPKTRKEEEEEEVEIYYEIDKDVPGLSGVAKTELFNAYDPERIVEVIRKHKDVISRVRSISNVTIAIEFNKNSRTIDIISAMADLKKLDYDTIDQDGLTVMLWWD